MLALLLHSSQAIEPAPSALDQTMELEIDAADARLAGHGSAERVEHRAPFRGTLHAWAALEGGGELLLRVEDEDGTAREDGDSGGGSSPYLALAVEPGERRVVWVALARAESGAGPARVRLHLAASPESEDTRAAAQAGADGLAEVRALRAGDPDGARTRVDELIGELLAGEGNGNSEAVSARLWDLAGEAYRLGSLRPACRGVERVLAQRARTRPDTHPDLQAARLNLGAILQKLGDLAGARAQLERVVATLARTLDEDHADLQRARLNLAAVLSEEGDLAGARRLEEGVLATLARTLPDDHPSLQKARTNLAATLERLGELEAAQRLVEQALATLERALPGEHPMLQTARQNVAAMRFRRGDLPGARALFESIVEALARTLPEEHVELLKARAGLGATLLALGDLQGALALQQQILDVLVATRPDDASDLQIVRQNVAVSLEGLGRSAEARTLKEKVLEVALRTLGEDDLQLLRARSNLATSLYLCGEIERARELYEQGLAAVQGTLPATHPDLNILRSGLAVALADLGELERACALSEEALRGLGGSLPDHDASLQTARAGLLRTLAKVMASEEPSSAAATASRARLAELHGAWCRAQVRAAGEAVLTGSSREAEERCARLTADLDLVLSLATLEELEAPQPALLREAFRVSETTRCAALGAAALRRAGQGSERAGDLRAALRRAEEELAMLAQAGASSATFQAALVQRDSAERELARLAQELGAPVPEITVESLAARLGARDALVVYRRYGRMLLAEPFAGAPARATEFRFVDSLGAFVLRADARLAFVDLGPSAAIEASVHGWRTALQVGGELRGIAGAAPIPEPLDGTEAGARLRALVLDPLLAALEGVERFVIVADDVLHLVPFDALPAREVHGSAAALPELLGERLRIETRATSAELVGPRPPATDSSALVALGGIAYDEGSAGIAAAPVLRGGVWADGFAALPGTEVEVRGVAAHHRAAFGAEAEAAVLVGPEATRAALLGAAPRARWLHVATHGWFAPESIPAWSDARALDPASGLVRRTSGAEELRGMSPMLLCGLALAGANRSAADGHSPGLLTAEELAALDLTGCELAVLSACDTSLGERRAGQGVASLQRAFQMAGARSVVTSLWKVPDQATQELMLAFYRHMWIDAEPRSRALWHAKMDLRAAEDGRGAPRFTPRDWAGWVLSGDPE
jgi:CHAT domain-containing protein